MPAFFHLRRKEPYPSVRVVLGLFVFVYIHAYMEWQRPRRALPDEHDDSVGRIPVDGHSGNRPQRYVNALEKASVGEKIAPFADFLAGLVKKRLAGEPLPAVPKASF
jgi:hypothetical protein